jgi:hypothetical protein
MDQKMRIKRVSPRGLTFYLTTICEDKNITIIELAETGRLIKVNHPYQEICQGWWEWAIMGKPVQVAFSFLSPDEREFILSGTTSSEWENMFTGQDED